MLGEGHLVIWTCAVGGFSPYYLCSSFASDMCVSDQGRFVDGTMWLQPEGPYKTLEDLWDEEVAGKALEAASEE